MRKSILLLCMAGVLTANFCIPAAGVSMANIRSTLPATPAVQGQTYSTPDAEGTVSFQNLQSRMKTQNLTIQSLQATLDSKKAFDRKLVCSQLVDAINALSDGIYAMDQLEKDNPLKKDTSSTKASVESMSKQLKDLNEEDYNRSIEILSFQIEQNIQQMIMGGETLYLTILSTETTLSDLNRSLKTMERSLKEMELRYNLGQVSKLTFEQLKSTYTSTKSQASNLEISIEKMKASLQVLLGESPTGKLTLDKLPSLSQKQTALLRTNYDTALQMAKGKSLTISAANLTLEDAKKTWKDAQDDTLPGGYEYVMAKQAYQSAVFTHDSTVKNFELSFKKLYDAIPEAQQALESAEASYNYQKQNYSAAELKYQQGLFTATNLQAAEDALLAAQSSVTVAEIKVFTAWNNYEWAIERGMVS